jgi:hypothetical protein
MERNYLLTTGALLRELRLANPGRKVTEHLIRYAIRSGSIPAPSLMANRFAWTAEATERIAQILGLNPPSAGLCGEQDDRRTHGGTDP